MRSIISPIEQHVFTHLVSTFIHNGDLTFGAMAYEMKGVTRKRHTLGSMFQQTDTSCYLA